MVPAVAPRRRQRFCHLPPPAYHGMAPFPMAPFHVDQARTHGDSKERGALTACKRASSQSEAATRSDCSPYALPRMHA